MIQKIKSRLAWAFGKNKDKKLHWLVIVGLAGILLIALSEWLPRRAADISAGTDVAKTLSVTQVEAALEERMAELIGQVEGVGNCRVMVTLESGSRFVYAAEQSYSGGTDTYSGSEKTLLVETDAGPVGLLITEIQPTVKGVAVVCAGGDDPTVRERVMGLVSAAFNISSGRVCVVKQK